MHVLVIDSGTTNTRVRWFDGEQVTASAQRQVGARDVAVSGGNQVLKEAIKACIDELLDKKGVPLDEIEAIIASGMISSNMGLIEIPHVAGPVDSRMLASRLTPHVFADIADKPIWFVPGVKTGFEPGAPLVDKDMMRGEEAEIFGYLDSLDEKLKQARILFLHYGSHHKGILLSDGYIRQCRTSITGELMMAVSSQTILKSSLIPIEEMKPDLHWVRKGLEAAEQSGLGRALFSTRVLQVMEKREKHEASGFFIGALLSLDIMMLQEMMSANIDRVVLYGKELYPSLFAPIARERYPHLEIEMMTDREVDLLSAKGAYKLYRQSHDDAKRVERISLRGSPN